MSAAVPLRNRDLQALLTALDRLCVPVTPAEFPAHLFAALEEMLPGIIASFDFADLTAGSFESHITPSGAEIANRPLTELEAAVEALIWQHPSMAHLAQVDPLAVIQPTDFVSWRQFRATEFYQECHRPLRLGCQIAAGLAWSGHAGGFTVNRPGAGRFTDREVELVRRLRPHVQSTFAASLLLADLNARLAATKQATPPGSPGAADFAAERLLAHSLSRREAEVLRWLAEGKRDSEIARILGISTRTVHSHVAHILTKLRVETRTAAATTACRWLAG